MLKKIVLFTAATLLSTAAWAESYIYLTNNTDKTLSLSINQTGSPLNKGEHWRQHATSVGPYATVRYMDTNRDTGIKWGKSYQFDTTVTAPDGSTTVLRQHLTGTWNFSNISHGMVQSPWYTDRGLYSATQNFDGVSTQVAVRAQYARVNGDDYYYVIQPQKPAPQRGLTNNFKVLAYNVWALLPGVVSKSVSERLNLLQSKLNGYDAIVFSELFDNSRRETFLNGIRGEYPYQTSVVDKSSSIEDGGVLIVSRWPIETSSHTTFSECDAEDCLSAKGVKYARINKGGNKYHVFGSHTQAWTSAENQATRLNQFQVIRSFMDSKNIPATEPVIIAGDLNVDSINYQSEYNTMLNVLGAAEAPRNGVGYAHSFNGGINAWADGAPENLDYVLYSTNHLQPTSSASQVIIPRSIHSSVFTKYDLSDHFAVQGELTFNTPAVDAEPFRELRVANSGKCLDFLGADPANGMKMVMWDCAGVAWQKWKYDAVTGLLRNKQNPNFCLDHGGNFYNGYQPHMWQCIVGHQNQTWDFVGNSLRPRNAHHIALDAFGTGNGSVAGLWSSHGAANQQWSWGQ